MQSIDLQTTQRLAESGDIPAQLELGKLRLAQQRYDDAAVWLRRAAEQDSVEGQCLFGSLLSEGLGVDQDHEAAAYWLRKAAEQGHSGAQMLLAETFESGSGVPVNHALAAQWFLKAAEQGDNVAQLRYGILMRNGVGLTKDLGSAEAWLRKAAESKTPDAAIELVECLIEKPDFDMDEVIRWSQLAAEAGCERGQYRLAWALENSPHIRNSMNAAVEWYRKAGEAGNTEAQMRLAKLYAEEKIVAADPAEAERWLNMIVETGGSSKTKDVIQASAKLSGTLSPHISINEYPPGSIIAEKYFIMSLLGRGGMCMVYKAKHLLLNKMVALKMMLPESASNPAVVARFQREGQAASSLNHPNIITISDLGISPDHKPFMVMDYLEGRSLDQYIEEQLRLPIQDILHVFMQICAALDTAHEANIIHRDIKPSNIMLINTKTQKNFVKVVDFGLAKVMNNSEESQKLTKTGEVFGTLLYMSPEQCLGHDLDARTDIYSVGCAMYEAATGKPVHRGDTAYEVMSKHIKSEPDPIASLAPELREYPELERIIFKSLAKQREDRYQSMAAMYEDLEALKGSIRN